MISIEGLNKADVLAALYNASRPQGMGFMHYDPKPMTREDAERLLARQTYFDYLHGRVMKIDLKKDIEFDEWGYDRDNGAGTALAVITSLKSHGPDNFATKALHVNGVLGGAAVTARQMQEPSYMEQEEGTAVFHLGLAEKSDTLKPFVDAAVANAVTETIQEVLSSGLNHEEKLD